MNRARTLLAVCALALPIPVAVAGCGGDDDSDPREVLERTFDNDTDVTSGNFGFTLEISAAGEEEGSFTAEVGGPFQGEADATTLPQLDLGGSVSGEGGGESVDFEGRLVLTEESAFVEYENETYEVGARDFAQLKEGFESQAQEGEEGDSTSFREGCEQAVEQAGGDPSSCDIDVVGDWFTNLENEGTEDVGGTEAIHISGDLDVERALADISEIVQSIPGVDLQGFQPSQLATAVPEASFDVYSGADDDVLRGLSIDLAIEPAALTAGIAAVPVERVDFGISFTLSELNEPQTIDTPPGPTRPIEDLLGDDPFDLGDGLGGGLGAGGLGGGGGDAGGGGAGAGDLPGGEAGSEEAQEYFDCIAEAGGDPDAIEACGEQL